MEFTEWREVAGDRGSWMQCQSTDGKLELRVMCAPRGRELDWIVHGPTPGDSTRSGAVRVESHPDGGGGMRAFKRAEAEAKMAAREMLGMTDAFRWRSSWVETTRGERWQRRYLITESGTIGAAVISREESDDVAGGVLWTVQTSSTPALPRAGPCIDLESMKIEAQYQVEWAAEIERRERQARPVAAAGQETVNEEKLHPVPPVTGYRSLSRAEVDLMNEVKAAFNAVGVVLDKLANVGKDDVKVSESVAIDHRCVAIARTEAQTAAMWAIRSITKPGGFA